MGEVEVTRSGQDASSVTFDVEVRDGSGSSRHRVTCARTDLERLAGPRETDEDFVRRCFEFLLAREPKEAILRSFDVSVIGRYFPEFEDTISPG